MKIENRGASARFILSSPVSRVISLYRDAYRGVPRRAWILAFAEFINRSGFMVLVFLNIYLTQRLHFSLIRAGQVLSAYGLGAIAGGYIGGLLCERIGVRSVQVWSLVLSGLLLVGMGYVSAYLSLLLFLFLYGLISSALFPANDTAMSRFCRGEMRSKGFALRRLASNLGITIGPVIGGYLILIDYLWLFWVDGLTSLAAAVVIILALKPATATPAAPEDKTPDAGATCRSPWRDPTYLLFLGLFLILVTVFAQLFSTFSLYLNAVYGLKENRIGPLWAVNTLMIVLFEMVLLHSLRKRSEMKLVAAGALFIGAGFSLLPLGRGFFYAAFTVAVWTIGEMLIMPLTATVAANRAGSSAGRYLGLLSLTFSLSMFIAPMLGNWLFGAIGGDALWPTVGSACLFVAAGFWALRRRIAPEKHPLIP